MSGTATKPYVAERAGGVWDYISASRLKLWLKCPLAFKFKYADGIREPTTPSLFVGKQVHAGLEYFYRRRQLGLETSREEVRDHLAANWDKAVSNERPVFADSSEEPAARVGATRLVDAYLTQLPRDEPRPVAVETSLSLPLVDPFTGEDLGIPLVGIVDLVLPDEDGAVIVDFKTAGNSKPPPEIQHEIQLSCYAYLYRRMTAEQEAGLEIRSLVKTKTPQIVTHRYGARHEAHFRRLFAVIRAYLDDLDRGEFVYRPGWTCGMCDYRETHCSGWGG